MLAVHSNLKIFFCYFRTENNSSFLASSSFERELRWLIQRVHPIKRTPHIERSQSGVIQSFSTRQAFAAAKRAFHRNVAKRSSGKDFLRKVTSLIKENEDASVKSSGKIN